MKTFYLFIILILGSWANPTTKLQNFNEAMGKEQAEAYNAIVESFEEFLALNFPNQKTLSLRNQAFLNFYENQNIDSLPHWILPDHPEEVRLLFDMHNLRKEFRLWPNEKYKADHYSNAQLGDDILDNESFDEIINIPIIGRDGNEIQNPIPQDSSTHFNKAGKYIFALNKCPDQDSLVETYLDIKMTVGDISPNLMARGLKKYASNYEDPILLRIEVAEFYYWLLF